MVNTGKPCLKKQTEQKKHKTDTPIKYLLKVNPKEVISHDEGLGPLTETYVTTPAPPENGCGGTHLDLTLWR